MYLIYENETEAWARAEQGGRDGGLSYYNGDPQGSLYLSEPIPAGATQWALPVDGYELTDSEWDAAVEEFAPDPNAETENARTVTQPEPPECIIPVPESVGMVALKFALIEAGKSLPDIVAALPDEEIQAKTQAAIESATEAPRTSALVEAVRQAGGMSNDEMDNVFRAASTYDFSAYE